MAGTTWRYDPAKGGVYQDDEDQQPDGMTMPSAAPLTFEDPAGGAAATPAPAAAPAPVPTTGLPSGDVMGIPNTTVPLTLTDTHHDTTTPIKQARDTELEGQVASAAAGQAAAAEQLGVLKSQEKTDLAAKKGEQAQGYVDLMKEQQAADAALQGKLKAYDDETDRLRDEDARIPITDGWSNKSVGDKIASGVAILMNSLARGMVGNHGPDEVFDNIKANIDKDHAEQLRKHEERLKKIANLESGPLRDQALKEGERQIDVLKRKQAFMDGKIAAFIEANAAKTGSQEAIVEGKQLADHLRGTGAEKEAGLREHFIQKATTGGGTKQVVPGGAQGGPPDLTVQDLAGNVIGKGRTLQEAEKIRAAQGKATGLLGDLDDLKTHVLEHGRTDIGGIIPLDTQAVRAERENKIKAINGQLSALYAEGVLSEAEFKRSSGGLNTSVLKGGEAAAAGIDAIAASVRSAYNSHARSASILAPGTNPANREAGRPAAAPASTAPAPSPAGVHSKAVDWARAHPTDPRAVEILKVNGVQ